AVAQLGLLVVVEDLIGQVPLLDASGVAGDHSAHVLFEHVAQLVVGEIAVLHTLLKPFGVLRVPEQRVAAHIHAMGLGVLHHGVGLLKVELSPLVGVDELPFQIVLMGQGGVFGRQVVPVLLIVGERVRVVLVLVVSPAGGDVAYPDVQLIGPVGQG